MQSGSSIVTLNWAKRGSEWYRLHSILPGSTLRRGVYLIWDPYDNGRVVRLGQGYIAERLRAHRNEPEIQRGTGLLVTWAETSQIHLDGIERYLADIYQPTLGHRFPNVMPIPVNLPA